LRILTGGDDHAHLRWQVLEEEGERIVNGFGIDDVVIVDDKDEIARQRSDLIEQRCQS
jgi:hypothetical protein